MSEHGGDAGHCSNGLTARNYRGATAEDRATYRKWIRGLVVFYSTLLLICVRELLEYQPDQTHDPFRPSYGCAFQKQLSAARHGASRCGHVSLCLN
jgi:hypothetical protein